VLVGRARAAAAIAQQAGGASGLLAYTAGRGRRMTGTLA